MKWNTKMELVEHYLWVFGWVVTCDTNKHVYGRNCFLCVEFLLYFVVTREPSKRWQVMEGVTFYFLPNFEWVGSSGKFWSYQSRKMTKNVKLTSCKVKLLVSKCIQRAVSLLLTPKQIWCFTRQCSKLNICLKLLKKKKNYVTFFSKRLLCLFVSLSWFIVIASLPLKIYKLCPSKRIFSLFFPRYNLIYMNLPKNEVENCGVNMKRSTMAHFVFGHSHKKSTFCVHFMTSFMGRLFESILKNTLKAFTIESALLTNPRAMVTTHPIQSIRNALKKRMNSLLFLLFYS